MSHRFMPPLLLLSAAVLWSLGGVLVKSIDWHPMAIAGGRSAIAIPLMLVCIGRPRFTFSKAQIGGAIGYALTVVLFSPSPKCKCARQHGMRLCFARAVQLPSYVHSQVQLGNEGEI